MLVLSTPWPADVSSVYKQTGVDRANLIQLIAPIHLVVWNAVSAKSPSNNLGAVSRVAITVKLGVFNTRSVCNKTDVFTEHLTEVNMDLVAITETWLITGDKDNKTIKDLSPADYKLVHVPRKKPPTWCYRPCLPIELQSGY